MRLLCADYTLEDINKAESQILRLIFPKASLMDFNIAASLHFASKCEGYLFKESYFEDRNCVNFKLN